MAHMAFGQIFHERTELVTADWSEIYRLKSGKASETVSKARDAQREKETEVNSEENSVPQKSTGSTDSPTITLEALWERLDRIEDNNNRARNNHSEIISNLAANVLTVMDKVKDKPKNQKLKPVSETVQTPAKTSTSHDQNMNIITVNQQDSDEESEAASSDNGIEDISDDELDLDAVMDESRKDDSENQDWLDELEKIYQDKSNFGDSIDEKIAKLLNQAIQKQIAPETLKEIEDKNLIPENCKYLQVPKINKELWSGLQNKDQRAADLALQSAQKCLSTSLVMVIKSLELIKAKGDMEKVKATIRELFKILSNGFYTVNKKRKQMIVPNVPYKYRKVVDIDSPTTEYLFGDNLDTKLEDVEKEHKRADKLSISKPSSFLEKKKKGEKRSYDNSFLHVQKEKYTHPTSRDQHKKKKKAPQAGKGKFYKNKKNQDKY